MAKNHDACYRVFRMSLAHSVRTFRRIHLKIFWRVDVNEMARNLIKAAHNSYI